MQKVLDFIPTYILFSILGILVTYLLVYYASRGWKRGQSGEGLIGDRWRG